MRTEHPFTLPRGYVDEDGTVHRKGRMRLATARDELEVASDPRARDDELWATVLLLARTVTRLGKLAAVTTDTVQGLFAADLAYLQEHYTAINFGDPESVPVEAVAS